MKTIKEYINESILLDESKKDKLNDILNGLDKINKWNKADNHKKLMSEYMSAGDAEDLKKEHWDCCVDVVSKISDIITGLYSGAAEAIDIEKLVDEVMNALEYDEKFIDDLNKKDKEVDWYIDEMIDLFNAVSIKVCKEAWLI